MRQFQWVACGVGLAIALGACSSTHKNGMAPPGDFGNPSSILGGSAGAGTGTGTGTKVKGNQCAEGGVNASRLAPRVVLVLDGSCSMSTDYPANGAMSASMCVDNPKGRWAALRSALVDPQRGVVPKLQTVVQFGVAVFGTQPTCPIPATPVQPELNNLAMITARMPMVQPGMYTPTGPALDWVYDNMIEEVTPDSSMGPQIVILATDGEPNSCGGGGGAMTNYQPSLDALKKGAKKGVKTYVISLADAAGAFHDHLQELANLGDPSANGAAKLYTPASPEQLQADLQALVGGAVGCDIALNGTIVAGTECSGTVTLNGKALTCNGGDGWKLLDASHIRLQGTACKTLTDNKASIVEARFPCTSFIPS